MAEWLRREIRNLMGSARVGSNPAADVQYKYFSNIYSQCSIEVIASAL